MKASLTAAWAYGRDNSALILVLTGLVFLYVPSYWNLISSVWWRDEQGHGPLICGLSWWLLWRKNPDITAAGSPAASVCGWIVLLIALAAYFLGHSQAIDTLEVFSLILLLVASILLVFGWPTLRKLWFPLFFMLFMVPMPGIFVQALTLPMKILVSQVASNFLYYAGYPIARSGVVLSVGQYQILVADACAGLNTLFTLESIGLLYMYLNPVGSKLRSWLLAVSIIPIAFIANVIRVIVLILVTYHLGDAAGQGFMHQFAGILLFTFALLLIFMMDSLLSRLFPAHTDA